MNKMDKQELINVLSWLEAIKPGSQYNWVTEQIEKIKSKLAKIPSEKSKLEEARELREAGNNINCWKDPYIKYGLYYKAMDLMESAIAEQVKFKDGQIKELLDDKADAQNKISELLKKLRDECGPETSLIREKDNRIEELEGYVRQFGKETIYGKCGQSKKLEEAREAWNNAENWSWEEVKEYHDLMESAIAEKDEEIRNLKSGESARDLEIQRLFKLKDKAEELEQKYTQENELKVIAENKLKAINDKLFVIYKKYSMRPDRNLDMLEDIEEATEEA